MLVNPQEKNWKVYNQFNHGYLQERSFCTCCVYVVWGWGSFHHLL